MVLTNLLPIFSAKDRNKGLVYLESVLMESNKHQASSELCAAKHITTLTDIIQRWFKANIYISVMVTNKVRSAFNSAFFPQSSCL